MALHCDDVENSTNQAQRRMCAILRKPCASLVTNRSQKSNMSAQAAERCHKSAKKWAYARLCVFVYACACVFACLFVYAERVCVCVCARLSVFGVYLLGEQLHFSVQYDREFRADTMLQLWSGHSICDSWSLLKILQCHQ